MSENCVTPSGHLSTAISRRIWAIGATKLSDKSIWWGWLHSDPMINQLFFHVLCINIEWCVIAKKQCESQKRFNARFNASKKNASFAANPSIPSLATSINSFPHIISPWPSWMASCRDSTSVNATSVQENAKQNSLRVRRWLRLLKGV